MSPAPTFYAIIPANVRYCKNIEPNAKLLYGEITALTQKEGYCWASNSYFAELYDVDERSITNWLKSLEDEGFIEIDTQKKGMKWDRKIWIIQEKFTKGKNFPDREEKNFPIERKKFSTEVIHSNIKETTTAAPPPAAAFSDKKPETPPCLESLQLSSADKTFIASNYDQATIQHAITWALHPKTIIKSSLAQALKWACANPPEIPKNEACEEAENKSIALEMIAKCKKSPMFGIEALNAGVEIAFLTGQKEPFFLKYSEKGFKDQLLGMLKKIDVI